MNYFDHSIRLNYYLFILGPKMAYFEDQSGSIVASGEMINTNHWVKIQSEIEITGVNVVGTLTLKTPGMIPNISSLKYRSNQAFKHDKNPTFM